MSMNKQVPSKKGKQNPKFEGLGAVSRQSFGKQNLTLGALEDFLFCFEGGIMITLF